MLRNESSMLHSLSERKFQGMKVLRDEGSRERKLHLGYRLRKFHNSSFRHLLRHLAREWIGPILQLPEPTQGQNQYWDCRVCMLLKWRGCMQRLFYQAANPWPLTPFSKRSHHVSLSSVVDKLFIC